MKVSVIGAAVAALGLTVCLHAGAAQATVFTSEYVPGYCVDINMRTKQAATWQCHGGFNQNFDFSGYGQVKVHEPNGRTECLSTDRSQRGHALVLTACRNTRAQHWGWDTRTHQLRNEEGWCADINGGNRSRGAAIIAWSCGGQQNQKWMQGRVVPLSHVSRLGLNRSQLQKLQSADRLINRSGGNVIAAGGGNVIAAGGGNVIAAGGGNVIAPGGGN